MINTEVPLLMSKEYSNNQENDSHVPKASTGIPNSKIAETHRERWTALFDQMDEALSEEEKQLVSTQKIDRTTFSWSQCLSRLVRLKNASVEVIQGYGLCTVGVNVIPLLDTVTLILL